LIKLLKQLERTIEIAKDIQGGTILKAQKRGRYK
jgi:hypothetical protein